MSTNTYTLIFDNAGGLVMALENDGDAVYVHYYSGSSGMAQAVEDLRLFLAGEDPASWDGNELGQHRLRYDAEIERNGGARWYYDVQDIIDDVLEGSWANIQAFADAKLYISIFA